MNAVAVAVALLFVGRAQAEKNLLHRHTVERLVCCQQKNKNVSLPDRFANPIYDLSVALLKMREGLESDTCADFSDFWGFPMKRRDLERQNSRRQKRVKKSLERSESVASDRKRSLTGLVTAGGSVPQSKTNDLLQGIEGPLNVDWDKKEKERTNKEKNSRRNIRKRQTYFSSGPKERISEGLAACVEVKVTGDLPYPIERQFPFPHFTYFDFQHLSTSANLQVHITTGHSKTGLKKDFDQEHTREYNLNDFWSLKPQYLDRKDLEDIIVLEHIKRMPFIKDRGDLHYTITAFVEYITDHLVLTEDEVSAAVFKQDLKPFASRRMLESQWVPTYRLGNRKRNPRSDRSGSTAEIKYDAKAVNNIRFEKLDPREIEFDFHEKFEQAIRDLQVLAAGIAKYKETELNCGPASAGPEILACGAEVDEVRQNISRYSPELNYGDKGYFVANLSQALGKGIILQADTVVKALMEVRPDLEKAVDYLRTQKFPSVPSTTLDSFQAERMADWYGVPRKERESSKTITLRRAIEFLIIGSFETTKLLNYEQRMANSIVRLLDHDATGTLAICSDTVEVAGKRTSSLEDLLKIRWTGTPLIEEFYHGLATFRENINNKPIADRPHGNCVFISMTDIDWQEYSQGPLRHTVHLFVLETVAFTDEGDEVAEWKTMATRAHAFAEMSTYKFGEVLDAKHLSLGKRKIKAPSCLSYTDSKKRTEKKGLTDIPCEPNSICQALREARADLRAGVLWRPDGRRGSTSSVDGMMAASEKRLNNAKKDGSKSRSRSASSSSSSGSRSRRISGDVGADIVKGAPPPNGDSRNAWGELFNGFLSAVSGTASAPPHPTHAQAPHYPTLQMDPQNPMYMPQAPAPIHPPPYNPYNPPPVYTPPPSYSSPHG